MGFVVEDKTYDLETFDTLWKQISTKPTGESEEASCQLVNLKTYMCAMQNLNFKWMQDPKDNLNEISLSTK
jgi:hypothetical protein